MEELKTKIPFHCIISGKTNCGKTRFLIDQLNGPFRYVFEYIVLICPTFLHNKTYFNFAKNDKRFIVVSPKSDQQDEINNLLKICVDLFTNTNTLLILDDCAVNKD